MSSYLSQPPIITLVVLFVSIVMSFASSLINRHFVPREHREKVKALQRKVVALKKEKSENMKKAKSTGDKKLLRKAQKQEKQLLQLQSQVASLSMKQLRTMPITMILFLVVWLLLTGNVLGFPLFESPFMGTAPVAYLPWIGPPTIGLQFFWWYLICSLLFSTLFQRILGLTGGTD